MAKNRNNNPRRRNKSKDSGKSQSNNRHRQERNFKRDFAEESSFREPKFTVEQQKDLERLLSGIGKPEPKPFVPDDFQLEALEAIETQDVLVTAPTGSGKTWIAREEIRRLIEDGKRAWYTTPLKALTNSKYMEFGEEFGEKKCRNFNG